MGKEELAVVCGGIWLAVFNSAGSVSSSQAPDATQPRIDVHEQQSATSVSSKADVLRSACVCYGQVHLDDLDSGPGT